MSNELSIRHVSKFDGSNFLCWKFQITQILIAYDVYDLVTGARVKPANAQAPEAKAWAKDNAKAMGVISSAMEHSQLECLLTCVTAKEMWDKLARIHADKSAANRLLLTQRFHELRMSSTDSVVSYVAKVQNMASQLADLGESVSDVTIMARVLAGLTAKYAAFQTAWDSMDPARQTIENLQERLLREESRLSADTDGATALAAVKVSKTSGSENSKKKGKKKPRRVKDVECYVCQEKGHYARECPERKKRDKNKVDRGEDGSKSCAFVTTYSSGKRNDNEHSRYRGPSAEQRRVLLDIGEEDVWYIDSGCSRHVTFRRDWLSEFRPIKDGSTISLGDNGECAVAGEGTVIVDKLANGVWCETRIEHVLYAPGVRKNLFSVGVCTARGYLVMFRENDVLVIQGDNVIATGVKQSNDIFRLFFRVKIPGQRIEANVSTTSLKVWHERLGHLNKRALNELVKKGVVTGLKVTDKSDFFCDACQLGKSHRLPFKKLEKVSRLPGEFVHSDVCGPMSVESVGGAKYFVMYKDDVSGFRQVFFLKHKSDVYESFKVFERASATKFGRVMKVLRTDNGREYCNSSMKQYLLSRGIKHETTAPYTPEQNGKAERDNRTVVECARTMMQAKKVEKTLWAEAVNTAVYLLNRVSVTGEDDGKTPYEMWTGKRPDLKHVRVFGEEGFEHVPKQFTQKFDPKAKKVILVGYEGESTNYRLYHPDTKKVTVSRNVVFRNCATTPSRNDSQEEDEEWTMPRREEEEPAELPEVVPRVGNIELVPHADAVEAEPQAYNEGVVPGNEPRVLRNREQIRPPDRYQLNFAELNAPSSYEEAVSGPDAPQWTKAIEEELRAHEVNATWQLIPRNRSKKTIDSLMVQWVFKIIQRADGSVLRFKARLCARGFLQKEGVDYTETFSPVVRYDSLRVLLAVVTQEDLEMVQFDVRTAFLHGDLEEEIHMELPEGLQVQRGATEVVCQLKKALYGLKQAPRCWNRRFCDFLSQFGFKSTDADECIFYSDYKGSSIYLALFVDDGLIACKSQKMLDLIIHKLEKTFDVTLGDCSSFVGLQLNRDRLKKTMFLHQSAYTRRVLERFRMSEAKAVSVPADPHVVLQPLESSEEKSCSVPYREAVGSLMFLATVSRPDIAFAVNAASKFLNNPGESHWRAVKRIFAFLVGTKDVGIMYRSGGDESELRGYSDADFASDLETRRSTTGYVLSLANGPVSWASQRQKLVVLSTTEAEYVAASAAAREAIWLRRLMSDVGCRCENATVLFVDSQSTIRLAKNRVFHKRTKHIDIRYHHLREMMKNNIIRLEFAPSESQRADIFTKALPRERFLSHSDNIGLSEC